MFSLRKQISHLDDVSEAQKILIEALGGVMDSVVKHLPEAPKDLLEEPRRNLKTIRAGVVPTLDKDGVHDTRHRFNVGMEDYGKKLTGYVRRQERETMEILDLLSSVADQFAKRDTSHASRMQSIARKLRLLTTGTDLTEIKWKLAQEVEQLEKAMGDVTRGNAAVLQRLQESLTDMRPSQAEHRPSVRLPNIQRRPGRQCLALFVVDRPDERVKKILSTFIEPHDHIDLPNSPGFGATEFGITKECSLPDMITVMETAGAELQKAGFVCQSGAAERLRGEEPGELVRRARQSATIVGGR